MGHPVEKWHAVVEQKDQKALSDLIADDAVFHSPVVHTPQQGKALTFMYLSAAFNVLGNDDFEYAGEYLSDIGAVLEFKTVIDGVEVNGIDMITFNEAGQISDFKVMLRPLKAVNLIHQMMGEMLKKLAG